jgi:uncharacterized C2H2 Zn-finger protein
MHMTGDGFVRHDFRRPPYRCHACGAEFLDLKRYQEHVVVEHLG